MNEKLLSVAPLFKCKHIQNEKARPVKKEEQMSLFKTWWIFLNNESKQIFINFNVNMRAQKIRDVKLKFFPFIYKLKMKLAFIRDFNID